MKLAWLIYRTAMDIIDDTPDIVFTEPYHEVHYKIIPIIYAEVVPHDHS